MPLLHRCLHASVAGKWSNIEEMTEAIHVACAIRGGASLVHGVQMRNVAEKPSM
jgi:4-carboxymuconolactone decarboxylase